MQLVVPGVLCVAQYEYKASERRKKNFWWRRCKIGGI